MIVDGRDVSGVADLAAALAWVAVDMTRRFTDARQANRNPVTVWGAEAKRDWGERLPYRLHHAHAWRVRRHERVEKFGRDPSPITMSTVDSVWNAINRARGATVVIVVEHADHWVDRLGAADRIEMAKILDASTRSPRLVLLARDERAFADWVPESAVVRMPILSDTSVATWLVDRFAEGGWTLDPDVASQWAVGLDCQPAAVARHAGVVWEYLEAPPGPVRAYDIKCGLLEVIARDAARYEAVWDACTSTQQDVLRVLAREGGHQPTRGRGMSAPKASTVQRAIESLIARDIVWREPTRGSRVRFTDSVFRYWITRR
ncbi:hypothetical protein [Gemmatimonas sp.]|uniref:hypothetical protein n=1 Tax=Gemmatimonas sp. TaxID=1962908 RepID=UPI0025C4E461|nr:hypothetical protein [Gemmatimonas sp.]